jgi:hypothetical protein
VSTLSGYAISVSDATPDPVPRRVPKYKAPGFMRKEIELFLRARNETILMRRYGDNDAPVPPVTPLGAVRAVRSVREINPTIR